ADQIEVRAPRSAGEADVTRAAADVKALAGRQPVLGAVDAHHARRGADVDDAELAALQEVLRAQLGRARQDHLPVAARARTAHHKALLVVVGEPHLPVAEQVFHQEAGAQAGGVEARDLLGRGRIADLHACSPLSSYVDAVPQ